MDTDKNRTDVDASEDVSEDIAENYTDNDRRDMKRMGKKQELLRNFRIFTCEHMRASFFKWPRQIMTLI